MFNCCHNVAPKTWPALVLVVGAAVALAPWPALAEAAGAEAGPMVEEIIVTARKRQESLLEIPESVAAFSGDEIARQSMDNLRDIGLAVPNLHDPVFGPGNINIGTMGQPRLFAASLSYRF